MGGCALSASVKAVGKKAKISKIKESIERGKYIPTLTGVIDAGFQGESYKFNDKTDMVSGSIVLNWKIFNGLKRNIKIEKAKQELNKIENAQTIDISNPGQVYVVEASTDLSGDEYTPNDGFSKSYSSDPLSIDDNNFTERQLLVYPISNKVYEINYSYQYILVPYQYILVRSLQTLV